MNQLQMAQKAYKQVTTSLNQANKKMNQEYVSKKLVVTKQNINTFTKKQEEEIQAIYEKYQIHQLEKNVYECKKNVVVAHLKKLGGFTKTITAIKNNEIIGYGAFEELVLKALEF